MRCCCPDPNSFPFVDMGLGFLACMGMVVVGVGLMEFGSRTLRRRRR